MRTGGMWRLGATLTKGREGPEREEPVVEGKRPGLFRENDRLSVRQRQRCLQEVQNYSSSREKKSKREKRER